MCCRARSGSVHTVSCLIVLFARVSTLPLNYLRGGSADAMDLFRIRQ
jgi:hypothetical protein